MTESILPSYIVLIGLILILYNTVFLIAEIGYHILFLVLSFCWEILKLFLCALRDYPLTVLATLFLIYAQNRRRSTRGGKGIFYRHIVFIFGYQKECCICLETKVDKVLEECGHFYHSRCIDPWILKKKEECPFCRTYVSKRKIVNQRLSWPLFKVISKNNKLLIASALTICLVVAIIYQGWWRGVIQNTSEQLFELFQKILANPRTVEQTCSPELSWVHALNNQNNSQEIQQICLKKTIHQVLLI